VRLALPLTPHAMILERAGGDEDAGEVEGLQIVTHGMVGQLNRWHGLVLWL
jgi:hypothetical protein